VPLFDRDGNMFGSICHFNLEPTPFSDDDVYLMEAMASLLQQRPEIND
jgi:GAF domain-containing protein